MKVLQTTLVLAVAACIGFVSCKKKKEFTTAQAGEVYLDLPEEMDNYFIASNKTGNAKARLGRVLFYDTHLSLNNSVSCGTCHKQALAFADDAVLSHGFENIPAGRNTPPIQNLAELSPTATFFPGVISNSGNLFWDGRENSLINLVARPISNHVEMGMDLNSLPEKLSQLDYYKDLFRSAYGDEVISVYRVSECVAFFMSALKSEESRFDAYLEEGEGVLNAIELQGLHLFQTTYRCSNCHRLNQGTYMGDDFRDIGLDLTYNDKGAGVISRMEEDNGKFKTPNLRNVGVTAPYMHDGRFRTLKDVLDHYSRSIKNSANLDENLKDTDGRPMQMNISEEDKDAIVAFLNTFTDKNFLTDPKFSNPFKVR